MLHNTAEVNNNIFVGL